MSDDVAPHEIREMIARMFERHNEIPSMFERIIKNQETIMAAIDDLNAAVAAETTVDQSVETLLTTLAAQISAGLANNDTAAIEAAVATMKSNAAALSAAVVANTPAAPAPAPASPTVPAAS